jgi:hypothetical protein
MLASYQTRPVTTPPHSQNSSTAIRQLNELYTVNLLLVYQYQPKNIQASKKNTENLLASPHSNILGGLASSTGILGKDKWNDVSCNISIFQ